MTEGVRAALVEALAADDGEDAAAAVQSALFELSEFDTGALAAPSPFSQSLSTKKGRPKGAKNRRNTETLSWLLSMHRHPLSVIMEGYSMTPAEFAERIGLAKHTVKTKERREVAGGIVEVEVEVETNRYSNDVLLEIVKLQLRMAEAALPFVAQKQPQAVQVDGGSSLTIAIGGVHLGGGVSDPARGVGGGNSDVIEGTAMAVQLGQVGRQKSDGDLSD